MNDNTHAYRRRSIRLKDYDYSQPGSYFVTVCVHERKEVFGKILDGTMHLNQNGLCTKTAWMTLPKWFSHIELDEFVIIPNHMHGIINILDYSPVQPQKPCPPLGQMIRAYKAATSHQIRISGTPDFQW